MYENLQVWKAHSLLGMILCIVELLANIKCFVFFNINILTLK